METKYIHNTHPHSPFLVPTPAPTGTHPEKSLAVLHFLNWVYIDSPKGFHLALQVYMYCSFLKLIPSPITNAFSITTLPWCSTVYCNCIILYSYIDWLFIFHHSYFSFAYFILETQ
jgi:hypothetical protein